MKNPFLFFLVFLPCLIVAQNKKHGKDKKNFKSDTVSTYKCSYQRIQNDSQISYKINGNSVDKDEFEKRTKSLAELKNCQPCYLRELDLNETLLASGPYYYVCPNTPAEQDITVVKENSAKIFISNNSCKHGEWLFYDAAGIITKKELYNHGILVSGQ